MPSKKKQLESEKLSLNYLKYLLAYVEIKIDDPLLTFNDIPVVHPSDKDFTYPIFDYGNILISSKGLENLISGQSMMKMNYTIDKMISILYAKFKEKETQSGETRAEVRLIVDGFELCVRKVFESIINLPDNWVIANYDPGEWGNSYLKSLKKMSEKGYPYPPPSPRDYFKNSAEPDTKNKNK